jgi:Tfp pilus assembly protein FimT
MSACESSQPRSFIKRCLRAPSIVDLAVILALITVASGLAIPYFFSRPQVTLDHAAILLANDLRYTQNEAAISGETTRVVFQENGDGYQALYKSGGALPNPVGGADLQRVYSFDAIFQGVRLSPRGGAQTVEFDRNGFAVDGLEVEFFYKDGSRVLSLERGSGMMHIEGLEGEWLDNGL